MKLGMEKRKTVLFAYVAVLAAGIAVAALVYLTGKSVLDSSMPLLERDIPLLNTISSVKVAIAEQETLVYEYYATTNRVDFLKQYEPNHDRIHKGLETISKSVANPRQIMNVQVEYDRMMTLASQLDGTLKKIAEDNVDWDLARSLLIQVSAHANQVNAQLDLLVNAIQDEVFADGHATESKIHVVINVVLAFTAIILVIALFVGYYVNAFLGDVDKRRRMALFAEKNPNPVMRLSLDGRIRWANPASAEMLKRMGVDTADPSYLLPADLTGRLQTMQGSNMGYERWEYEVGEITVGCGIHYLPKYGMFHAYLSDITERKRAEQKLIHQAYHDALTGLPNRRRFREDLEGALAGAGEERSVAVCLLNLDRFNVVIRGLGHLVGDRLLRSVAERLENALRECKDKCNGAKLYRFEGDTFSILISKAKSDHAPVKLAERITALFDEPFYAGGHEFFITPSTGISVYPSDGSDAVALVKNADTALHQVKQDGGQGYQCYNHAMSAKTLDRLALENALRRALELKELTLHYQPQVDIASGSMIGMEVLVRWQNPKRGFVSPADFIPLAEETGLIVPMGEWIMRTACAQNKAWQDQGLPALTVAVNISARQFQQKDFTQMAGRVLRETGLRPEYLELEITEGVVMQNAELAVATLRELKSMGIKLSIDDFGTGYSSLSYLKRFPIDKLKVDQSFVRNLTSDANDAAITRAVIDLGHSLNLKVIAEGVETHQHLAFLHAHACDEIQGYLFSRPVPADKFAKILTEDRRLSAPLAIAEGNAALAAA